MRLTELHMTCESHPSQWEGATDDGQAFYARYRHGELCWGFGSTVDEAILDAMLGDPKRAIRDGRDGWMDTATMLALTGLEVADDA